LKFDDHFVIKPTIQFIGNIDFTKNGIGEKGELVEQGFEFNSGNQTCFLTIDKIIEFNKMSEEE
jgi:UDP-N-acetylglucosamine 4,6-dehydratase